MPYGIPTVYPESPNTPAYHNRSVWPFVQAFWNLAAAKEHNGTALTYGLAAIYRESALFLTNKENFVADTGSPVGTVINSDRQLWSVAGYLAMVYRVLFGMEFATDGLHLHPIIPEQLAGNRTLTNFHYRGATLSIQVRGFGDHVRFFTLDGKSGKSLIGKHAVVIEMDGHSLRATKVHLVEVKTAPETPAARLDGVLLTWGSIEGSVKYDIYRDGSLAETVPGTSVAVTGGDRLSHYQVAAINSSGEASFLSPPIAMGGQPILLPVDATSGGSGESFMTLDQTGVTGLSVSGVVPSSGHYSLSFRYANGSGPVNTDNKCAVRTLFIDGKEIGPIVLPQRGQDAWTNWGMSNSQVVELGEGRHRFELRLLPEDLNMNGEVNRAQIASISLARLD